MLRTPGQRGAASVEKLMVMLLAICFFGAIIAVLGPTLAAKYEWAANLLSFGGKTTIAQREAIQRVEPEQSIGLYVFLFITLVVVIGGFIVPILFPRAHRARSAFIQKVARKNKFLAQLADVSLSGEYSIAELRSLAAQQGEVFPESRTGGTFPDSRTGGMQYGNPGYPSSPSPRTGQVLAIGSESDADATVTADVPITPRGGVPVLPGFGGASDDEPTQDYGSLPQAVRDRLSNDSDAIPFDNVPKVPTESPVHAGRASDDETVRHVMTGANLVVPEDDDKTKLQIQRPSLVDLDAGADPDAPTQSHASLRSRLANRRKE